MGIPNRPRELSGHVRVVPLVEAALCQVRSDVCDPGGSLCSGKFSGRARPGPLSVPPGGRLGVRPGLGGCPFDPSELGRGLGQSPKGSLAGDRRLLGARSVPLQVVVAGEGVGGHLGCADQDQVLDVGELARAGLYVGDADSVQEQVEGQIGLREPVVTTPGSEPLAEDSLGVCGGGHVRIIPQDPPTCKENLHLPGRVRRLWDEDVVDERLGGDALQALDVSGRRVVADFVPAGIREGR